MTTRERAFFTQGINMYVPGMQKATNIDLAKSCQFSLGTPAALNASVIGSGLLANAVATTRADYTTYTADSPYGRTLIITPSADPGAAGGVLDVFGEDYLGQPMVERFTGANGSTAILYGKKAFYRVLYSKIVTATTNAITYSTGVGYRLGLPYKGDVVWAKEAGIYVPVYNRDESFRFLLSDADLTSGISVFMRAPFPGFVKELIAIPNGAGSTNDPVCTVELGGVAITGLTVTLDTSDVAGLLARDTPTTAGYSANNRFRPDGLIELVSAAAASAGSGSYEIVLTPTQYSLPVLTDPQTTTTGDPRGTYESLATMDGVVTVHVGIIGDNAVNSSGNGGLHGIKHVIS